MKWVNNIAFERYAYDAAGRMVREGNKIYRYGYLDKVLSVTDGDTTRAFTYHADGQLASASLVGTGASPVRNEPETFLWDGLALIQRGDEQFVNEPHVGGGNPVASSKGTSYFNDALGTTVGSKSNGKYSAAALTAFGENHLTTEPPNHQTFFTGKPYVEGLGHAFLMRNYRAGLAKWQTADHMGYPDGWNQLVYCGNGVTSAVDLWGGHKVTPKWNSANKYGVTIIKPPDSEITLGHWWSVDAECNGDPTNLQITYNITTVPASKDQFNAPFFVEEGAYTDNKATYFDFSCKVLPVDGYPKKWNQGGVAHIEVQFNLEIKYKVRYSYQYFDENGEIQIGYATQTIVRPLENVVLECQHRIPE